MIQLLVLAPAVESGEIRTLSVQYFLHRGLAHDVVDFAAGKVVLFG